MSHPNNDQLYDRANDLLPSLTAYQAEELYGYLNSNDLDTARYYMKVIEDQSLRTDSATTPIKRYPNWNELKNV